MSSIEEVQTQIHQVDSNIQVLENQLEELENQSKYKELLTRFNRGDMTVLADAAWQSYQKKEEQLREKKNMLLKTKQQLREENKHIRQQTDVEYEKFDGSKYSLRFPFFQDNGAKYLGVIGREKEFQEINKAVDNNITAPKYSPMIITGSRGIGKTFLLKKIGMQDNHNLANEKLTRSRECGRIISYDCTCYPVQTKISEKFIKSLDLFFPCLMIYFLCDMFNERQVDGISFFKVADVERVLTHQGKQSKFNEWIETMRKSSVDDVAAEYIRLTNIAFGVKYDNSEAPLVILLDEMQYWGIEINFHSNLEGKSHTILSYLLYKLFRCRPLCICTGTHNGNIFEITKKSVIVPTSIDIQVFSEEECKLYWRKMTKHWMKENKKEHKNEKKIEYSVDDVDVIELIYASYRIPRLLYLATLEWFQGKCDRSETEIVLQSFKEAARKYYTELFNFVISDDLFSVAEIVQVILHCSVCIELDLDSMVPGSNRWKWKDLVHKSIIFPATYSGTYLLPFTYIWNNANGAMRRRKKEIRNHIHQLIPGLVLEDLVFDFQKYYNADPEKIGDIFENLIVSSTAVKIYLSTIKSLFGVFGCDYAILGRFSARKINGIERPPTAVFVDACPDNKITHNIHATAAHHNFVLQTLHKDERGHEHQVAVACSMIATPSTASVVSQMKISKQSQKEVDLLLWILEDNEHQLLESNAVVSTYVSQGRLLFINPDKCCNRMALDLISLSKKVNSRKRPLE